jgi:hypothetical protein
VTNKWQGRNRAVIFSSGKVLHSPVKISKKPNLLIHWRNFIVCWQKTGISSYNEKVQLSG